jgi:HAD superfamily hydrolase (TIGR01509 family)
LKQSGGERGRRIFSAKKPVQRFSAILFDLDGVIIDSEPLHEEAKRIVFTRHSIEVPESLYDQYKGKTDWDIVTHVVHEYADGKISVEEMLAEKQEAFRGLVAQMNLIPRADVFIRAAAQEYRLALTTSATPRNQRIAFDQFGLWDYFEAVVTAEDITRAKPDPEPYLITCKKLNLAPEACLVIEDSLNGVLSGSAAGCTVAALTTSFGAQALERAGAHVVVNGFEALADHLTLSLS